MVKILINLPQTTSVDFVRTLWVEGHSATRWGIGGSL